MTRVLLDTESNQCYIVGKNAIVFDMRGGEFTHVGNLCTFEVLIKSFGLKYKTLRKIAEIVHDLDMKDDKYKPVESKGLISL
ncbi:MAG: chromate resistance protein ChrB domain-containing protein [Thermodesulfovibrionales bacterium]